MKIVHVSTSDSGGAAKAAINLHLGLLNNGLDSSFLCLQKTTTDIPGIFQFEQKKSFVSRIKRKLGGEISTRQRLNNIIEEIGEPVEYFSSPESEYQIHKHPLVISADIIHLHWVADFIDYPTFFKNINKKVVWTLHDFNPVLGGFHYQYEKNKSRTPKLRTLDNKFAKIKKRAINRFKYSLSFISPSNWMNESFDNIYINGRIILKTIFNVIPENIFHTGDKSIARTNLMIEQKEIVFICIATDLKRHSKGFNQLVDAFDKLYLKYRFKLFAIGKKVEIEREYLQQTDLINDDEILSKFYAAADAFVSASFEETFSLTCAQALTSGIPVISTPTGMMNDLIINGVNGFLTKDFEVDSLIESIEIFFTKMHHFEKKKVADSVENLFSEMSIVKQYLEVYRLAEDQDALI